jgi:trehalose-phosphatase
MTDNRFQAAILDMDGVITQTAAVHAQAWKQTFDEFLHRTGERTNRQLEPFDIDQDYRKTVDGKPRYDGVRSFLDSRGIKLAEGHPTDPPEKDTVFGLGNRKNRRFLELINEEGVRIWEDALAQIVTWKSQGLKVAVFSSSRNCRQILESAGILEMFDAKVDGNDLQRLGLSGKPSPDMLLSAAEQLGVDPSRSILVEDSIAGVQAAVAGGFGCIVGVARSRDPRGLKQAGADRIVGDLGELDRPAPSERDVQQIVEQLAGRPFALFLDYDGTLTPIVRRPEDAKLSDSMRDLVARLAEHHTVAIISGRDLSDVQAMVGLENLVYAGSHGFDIHGPGGLEMQQEEASQSLPQLDAAEQDLSNKLQSIRGARVERKRFAIAIHYREVEDEHRVEQIEQAVDDAVSTHHGLRRRSGKKIFELQPDVTWDKGHALRWLIDKLQIRDDTVVVYIGDDVTDEDAFRALRSRDGGIGIRVAETPNEPTRAHYLVRNCEQVEQLLESLVTSQVV